MKTLKANSYSCRHMHVFNVEYFNFLWTKATKCQLIDPNSYQYQLLDSLSKNTALLMVNLTARVKHLKRWLISASKTKVVITLRNRYSCLAWSRIPSVETEFHMYCGLLHFWVLSYLYCRALLHHIFGYSSILLRVILAAAMLHHRV